MMNTSKRLLLSLVALPLAIGIPTAAMAQDEGSGGTLVAAIGGEPDQLDPQATTSYNSFQVLENVFDTLVEPDENLQMQPALAEDWTISDDGLTYTFTLRDGVTWHDGSPFTANDVVYSFRRIIDEPMANSWRFSTVTDISAPDDSTVVFTVSQATPNLLSNLGGFKGVAVVQQANVESGDIQTAPIGTGPFKLADYTSGTSIELVRNDDWWGGAPALDGVTFQFIPDPTVALTNLQGGEVHWTDNLPPQQVSGLMDSSEVMVRVRAQQRLLVLRRQPGPRTLQRRPCAPGHRLCHRPRGPDAGCHVRQRHHQPDRHPRDQRLVLRLRALHAATSTWPVRCSRRPGSATSAWTSWSPAPIPRR